MLTKFEVENYRNFKDKIVINFKDSGGYQFNSNFIQNNITTKILIYGKNSSGKTNFGRALMDIAMIPYYREPISNYLNANSSKETAKFKYCFVFDNKNVEYEYEKDSCAQLTKETFIVDGKTIYAIDYKSNEIVHENLPTISAETLNIERFFEPIKNSYAEEGFRIRRPSFLRWIVANSSLDESSVLISLSNYIDRMNMLTVGNQLRNYSPRFQSRFFNKNDYSWVADFEDFLNKMGVTCKLIIKKLPDGEKELYFDYKKPLSFAENASSGTVALFNLYLRLILPAKDASFIYLDEFDAFYNYELAKNVFKYLCDNYPSTQIVYTTHNTNLMTNKLSRPDCLFILSKDGRITSMNNATPRELREGHNLEKLYISGEFEDYE